jgi:hypothetical protein
LSFEEVLRKIKSGEIDYDNIPEEYQIKVSEALERDLIFEDTDGFSLTPEKCFRVKLYKILFVRFVEGVQVLSAQFYLMFMAERIYDDSGYEWSYEIQDDVVVFDMKGWMGYDEDNLEAATQAYREVSNQDDINATVAIITDAKAIPPEQKDFIAKQWADNGNYVDVDKIGFVSEGQIGLTIKANIVSEVDDAEIENFSTVDEAMEWVNGE